MAKRGIYKRGNFYWIRYADITGKIVRRTSGSTVYKEAEYMLHTEKNRVKEGKQPEAKIIKNHTFAELVEKYKKDISNHQPSKEVKGYILDRLVDRYGTVPLRRFNLSLIEGLQSDLRTKGLSETSTKGMSNAGINKVITTLKHTMTKAVDWEMVEEETLKKVRRVKMLPESKRLRFLSKEEAQGLVSVCDSHLKPIVITALHTGMRKGEILGLKWKQVDLRHGFILLSKTKNGERREVPINKTLDTLFKKSLPRRIDCPYVFHDPKTLKRYRDVKRSFQTALVRAEIKEDFHFHDLRHTFASLAIMSGEIDITTLSKLLGHKDLKMTMRYAHLAPAHNKKAAGVMDRILSENKTQETEIESTDTKLTHSTEKELAFVS